MGLLDIDALAEQIAREDDLAPKETLLGRRMAELLMAHGLTDEQVERALTTISEAAVTLREKYQGKVQKYLRTYGEMMLADLGEIFSFSALGESEVQDAFTLWLQNVLSMPLSLVDEHLDRLASENKVTTDELIRAADAMDFNLAFIDDVAEVFQRRRVAKDALPQTAEDIGGHPWATAHIAHLRASRGYPGWRLRASSVTTTFDSDTPTSQS